MSLPYMGNEYGDAGSGDSCDRSIPRPPVNSEVDVKLRSGAVVVFLQPPEGQGVQEQAGDVSERNAFLRSGSNTVYLTGALLYKDGVSQNRFQIPLTGFAQLSLLGDASSTASEGTLPFAITGAGSINFKETSSRLSDGTLPIPMPSKEAFVGRRFLVAVYSPHPNDTGAGHDTTMVDLAGNAWIDIAASEEGKDAKEGNLPFALYGTGVFKAKAPSDQKSAGATKSSVFPAAESQLDRVEFAAVGGADPAALVVPPSESSISISAFIPLNGNSVPIDWNGIIGDFSLTGALSGKLLGESIPFTYPMTGSAIVMGKSQTPSNSDGTPSGSSPSSTFSHPVEVIGSGRLLGARKIPSDRVLTMPLTASSFAGILFTSGMVDLTFEEFTSSDESRYIAFAARGTGNVVLNLASGTAPPGTFGPLIDLSKFEPPALPWTAPPRVWPITWPPVPPPPPFVPPRPGPDPAPGFAAIKSSEQVDGEPVQPGQDTADSLLDVPKIPGWIDPVPLEPEIIGPAIGPVKAGGDPIQSGEGVRGAAYGLG